MSSTTLTLGTQVLTPPPTGIAAFGRLLRSEWTKIRSVPSTAWSLAVLVAASIGLNTLVVSLAIANWSTAPAASRQSYLADPTGFLSAALNIAQIPLCVVGVLIITSEYTTGMIRSSVLAVPRRTPMLAAKAVVFAALAFLIGELTAFASFIIAQKIAQQHVPMSLSSPGELRAVFGVGLYYTALGLFAFAIGVLVKNTGAAITAVVGFIVIFGNLARLIPGTLGTHVHAYLPANAGLLLTHAHRAADDLLSPWQGFAVLCLWAALALGAAAYGFTRRAL